MLPFPRRMGLWENDLSGGGQTSYLLDHDGLLRMCVRDVEAVPHID